MAVEIENRAHLHIMDTVSVTGQKVREKTMILIKRQSGIPEEKEVRNPRLGLSARSVPRGQGWEMRALLASTTLNKGSYEGLQRILTGERLRDCRFMALATSKVQGCSKGCSSERGGPPIPRWFPSA